jgi:stringent starvation protein B
MISKSTKPYVVRAIWEWCADNGHTPYLAVQVDENTKVPAEFVKNGEIILNISSDATHKLTLGNELIQFAARFGGVSRECSVPMSAVRGIFARENGEGIFFQNQAQTGTIAEQTERDIQAGTPPKTPPTTPNGPAPSGSNGRKPHLQVVK